MVRRFSGYVDLIQTDGGPEFKSEFALYVLEYTGRHRIARPYKKNEQAFIEAFNRSLRKDFLFFNRHYHPDFLVEYQDSHKEIHETKGLPLLLWASTKLKRQSAEDFCRQQGWKYKLITKGSLAFYSKID